MKKRYFCLWKKAAAEALKRSPADCSCIGPQWLNQLNEKQWIERDVQHYYADTMKRAEQIFKFDPVLCGISHYRRIGKGYRVEMFALLKRRDRSLLKKGHPFWIVYGDLAANPANRKFMDERYDMMHCLRNDSHDSAWSECDLTDEDLLPHRKERKKQAGKKKRIIVLGGLELK